MFLALRRWKFRLAVERFNRIARTSAMVVLTAMPLLLSGPGTAQTINAPVTDSVPAADEAPPVMEEVAADVEASDQSIAARMGSIFEEIEGLRDISIRVQSGVVTLTGTVASQEDREKAEAIAARFAGVVTVENGIDRSYKVDTALAPVLGKFGDNVGRLARALPLLGVALAIGALIAALGYILAAQERLWRWVAPNLFLAELIAGAIRLAAIIAGLIVALQILGATALLGLVLGSAGVIGIALGFAVRDTVDNYVSSLMLSLRQPFRANDHVLIGESEGRVIRLTSRATILMTLDGNHLRIPNATVFKAIILNYSRNPQRRLEFDLGIDSDDDPMTAMQTGLAAIRELPIALSIPRSQAIIHVVGDSSIILRFFAWIDQRETDFGKGRSLAIQTAKHALEQAGYLLPEPIYRIRIDGRSDTAAAFSASPPEGSETTSPGPSGIGTAATDDTEPDLAVEQLVSDERSEGDDADLLDNRRPIE